MAKKPAPLPERGSSSAGELFTLVGSALSYWEGAEDVLMGLFNWLCGATEPIAVATYAQAPRSARVSMLDLALETYGHRLLAAELDSIQQAISRLKKLASVRNEIAHGHVSNLRMDEARPDGTYVRTADGHYLLPSLNEGAWHERSFRFHHTAASLVGFREEVRDHRWAIMQAQSSAQMREQQEDLIAGPTTHMRQQVACGIASRRITSGEWVRYLPLAEWAQAADACGRATPTGISPVSEP